MQVRDAVLYKIECIPYPCAVKGVVQQRQFDGFCTDSLDA